MKFLKEKQKGSAGTKWRRKNAKDRVIGMHLPDKYG